MFCSYCLFADRPALKIIRARYARTYTHMRRNERDDFCSFNIFEFYFIFYFLYLIIALCATLIRRVSDFKLVHEIQSSRLMNLFARTKINCFGVRNLYSRWLGGRFSTILQQNESGRSHRFVYLKNIRIVHKLTNPS